MFFYRFWIRFGTHFGSIWEAKIDPNRAKLGPRRLLKRYFFKNADFHADLRFPRFFHQNRPQDEAKIGLRSPQDGSKTVLKSFFFDVEICLRIWSVLGSVLVAFGAPLGSQVGAQFGQKFDLKLQDRSWAIFGLSWGGLGTVLVGLGAVLGGLGPLLGGLGAVLERHSKIIKKSMPKMTDLGPPRLPK